MRARNLKPDFFKDEEVADQEPLVRILWQGLWCMADRDGRLKDRPRRIKVEVLPYDEVDVNQLLDSLDGEFIQRYAVNGQKYIQVINFDKHQNPHPNEKSCNYPAPPEMQPSDRDDVMIDDIMIDEPSKLFEESSEPYRLARMLRKKILENNTKAKVPKLDSKQFQNWCLEVDRMIRLDKREYSEIESVINWSQQDDFWSGNILSAGSLRKQFDKMWMQATKKQRKATRVCRTCGHRKTGACEIDGHSYNEDTPCQTGEWVKKE